MVAPTWFSPFGSTPSNTVNPVEASMAAAAVLSIVCAAVKIDCDSCSGLDKARHRVKKVLASIWAGSTNFVMKIGTLIARFSVEPTTDRTGYSEKS